jgi:beta-glucosidase
MKDGRRSGEQVVVRSSRTPRRAKTKVMIGLSAACLAVALLILPAAVERASAGPATPIYLDTNYSFGERAADLVARLTPTQRASQLVSSQAPAITSVANPLLTATEVGGQTSLAAPAAAGDTILKVASVSGMAVGSPLVVDPAGSPESVTIAGIGTAASNATTLPAGASAGATNVNVASVSGMTVGHQIRIDTGANLELGTIQAVGTAAATATTLAAAAAVGATNVKVTSVTGMTVGHRIRIDSGASLEVDTIVSVGTAGAAGTGVTLATPLTLAHASGAGAQDLGTGITLASPLTLGHAPGAAAQDTGTGITVVPAVGSAHPFSAGINLMVGIAAYGWWNEALHGINAESLSSSGNAVTLTNTTSYPIDLSRGASWDPALTYEVAQAESDEAREVVRMNKLDLDFYSPTVNLGRDPRWGRNDESYGEDPLLEANIASQFVDGMEGKDQNGRLLPAGNGFFKTTTTLKHYALNNTEGTSNADPNGRLNGSSNTDERSIREYYTMPFRKIVQAAQNGAIMSSYNEVNGVPAAANTDLITTLMRETFGFQGYFTGDCDAVNEVSARHHDWVPAELGHAPTAVEQFAMTLGAGEDAECNAGYNGTGSYRGPTAPSTTQGGEMNAIGLQITTPTGLDTVNNVDVSATRLFTNRMKLGEFDPNQNVPWYTDAVARDQSYGVYPWVNTTAPTETQARLQLARRSGDASLVLLKNATTTRKDGTVGKLLPLTVPATGSFKVLVLGVYGNNSNFYLGGYSALQSAAGQANEVTPYAGIKSAIQALNPSAQVDFMRGFTGTGTNAGNCCTAIDPAAVAAAASYDYVVVYAGMDSTASNGTTGTEDRDRTSLALPGQEGQLISQVSAVNPNTVAVMETIGPQDVTTFEPTTSAILWSSFNGMRKGDALADVLLGTYNPSGRTPETWYQSVGELPSIYSYALRPVGPNGRTYMYFNGPVSYPFGYGLSYSTFGFSNLQISNHNPTPDDTISVSVDVTNTSTLDGNEIVEMYVNTPNADPSLERPIKRLEGFQKVFVAAGQTKTVTMPIKISDLAFWNDADQRFEVDQGAYGIQISTSSADADIQAQGTINVSGSLTPKPSVLSAQPRIMTTDDVRGISQRVIFPENVDIDSGLTVAMNDDSLYGWVQPGKSQPFPAGMTFSYSSDRPGVVAVNGQTIHTVGNGAATITATATYNGKSASTSFVVRVLSDLGSISYNGTPVPGFLPDVFNYDVIVPAGSPMPNVTATASSASVSITQATAVPGTATITATGPDGIAATYTVNFAPAATSDEFDGSSLDPKWTIVRQDSNLSIGGGALTITPEAGQLTTNNATTAKNLVLEPAFGNFYETTKVTFNQKPNAATQQAGLLVYQDDDNYLKFDIEATSSTNVQFNTSLEDTLNSNPAASVSPVQVNQTLNTTSANTVWPADNTIWLRISRKGTTYSTAYSLDGTTWTTVWTTGATLTDPKVGVYSYSAGAAAGALTSSFDFFHVVDPITDPVTTAVFAPATVNGWYPQNPTVTLSAVDTSNTGIASTSYRVDNGTWQTYSAPFTITGDGTHTLDYYSTDNFGDVETTHTVTLKIDTTKPVVAYTGNAGSYTPFQTVAIHCSATDPTPGSGIDIAATSCVDVNGPAYSFGLGDHTFTASAKDLAGNTNSAATTFIVTTGGCLGDTKGQVTVGAGQSVCVAPGAKVSGPVTVKPGGSLYIDGATISGPVKPSGAALVRICGSTITGPLTVDGSTGIVVAGGDAATGPCAGNTITGPVSLTNNAAGVEFNNNNVTGPLTITGNTGTLPPPDSGPVSATGNTVSGPVKIQH